jgi:flavorubredoxin
MLPALSPAHTSNNIIDYATSDGMNVYNASMATLPIKDFEGTKGKVQTWINELIEPAQIMNRITILTVVSNRISYIIPRCSTLTIQQVQEHVRSYLSAHQGHPKKSNAVLYCSFYASTGTKLRKKSVTAVLTT